VANDAGTGKSFLIDLISVIATGRPCPVITGSKSTEEMEKRLGSLLLEGSSMTSLDNLSHDIEGDLLAQMVTQTLIKVRVLGRSETPECEWRGTLFATGNNIRVVGDMARRTLVCRLDAKMERPELRKFKFDPIERVLENRGKYIAAAITIYRAYAASVRSLVSPLAGFNDWTRFVREPLVWLGQEDPVKSMEKSRQADPARIVGHELVKLWEACIGLDRKVTVKNIIQTANAHDTNKRFRGLLSEQAAAPRGDAIDPTRLGKLLHRENGKVYGNLRIETINRKGAPNLYVLRQTS
jgi:putative DNA primase/helicase